MTATNTRERSPTKSPSLRGMAMPGEVEKRQASSHIWERKGLLLHLGYAVAAVVIPFCYFLTIDIWHTAEVVEGNVGIPLGLVLMFMIGYMVGKRIPPGFIMCVALCFFVPLILPFLVVYNNAVFPFLVNSKVAALAATVSVICGQIALYRARLHWAVRVVFIAVTAVVLNVYLCNCVVVPYAIRFAGHDAPWGE